MLAADLLAAATVALGFAGYFAHLVGTPIVVNALFLLVIIAAVIYAGVGESVGLAIILTVIEAVGLIFIIVIGIPSWSGADFSEMPTGLSGVWFASALIFFAYLGFDELGNFAEEMRDPERNLPRALVITMVASTAIYILVGLSATAVAGWEALSTSQAPLAVVAATVLGDEAGFILSLMALAATANTVLLLLVSGSRSIYGMASSGVLPNGLTRLSGTNVPIVSAAIVLAIAAALVLLGDLARVAELTNGAILVSFMLVNLSLLWLAVGGRSSEQSGLRAADLSLSVAAVGMSCWLLVHTGWAGIAMAAALCGLGFVVSAGLRRGGIEKAHTQPT
jgi:APA family basic amino acid/polyamine antiporter